MKSHYPKHLMSWIAGAAISLFGLGLANAQERPPQPPAEEPPEVVKEQARAKGSETAAQLHHLQKTEEGIVKDADKRATSKEVKDFAKDLKKENAESQKALKSVAKQEGIKLPEEKQMEGMGMGPFQGDMQQLTQLKEQLAGAQGQQYDRVFVDGIDRIYTSRVQRLEAQRQKVQSPLLRSYIDQRLARLEQTLGRAQSLKQQLAAS